MLIFHVFFNGFRRGGGREAKRTPCAFSSCFIVVFEEGGREGRIEGGRGDQRDPYAHFPRVFQWFLKGGEGGREDPLRIFLVFYSGF